MTNSLVSISELEPGMSQETMDRLIAKEMAYKEGIGFLIPGVNVTKVIEEVEQLKLEGQTQMLSRAASNGFPLLSG